MGAYGLRDSDQEDSFDISLQTRKRTYPDAFPETDEDREEVNLHNSHHAVPIAIDKSQEWLVPLGLTPGSVMDCLKTAFGWIHYALVQCGGKFFNTGISHVEGSTDCSWFMDGEG